MQFASIGSGSRGNATLFEADGCCVMVDCGFSVKETERRLAACGRNAEQLSAILVTHEHGDHVRGVKSLAKKFQLPVFSSRGTARAAGLDDYENWHCIDIHESFELAAFHIQPVAVPHDAREPCQFVLSDGDWKVGLLTDTGSITSYIEQEYTGCDALILETNHDELMLANGPYPEPLKQRVGGRLGHLSNRQANGLLMAVDTSRLQWVVASHISEKNNTELLARNCISQALGYDDDNVIVANQETGFEWCVLRHHL